MGHHGRERFRGVVMCGVLLSIWAAPLRPQGSFQDLAPELAARLAQVVPPASPVSLDAASFDTAAALLTAAGLRVVAAADGIASIRLECSENVRERVCTAEIRREGAQNLVIVTRPHGIQPPVDVTSPLALQLRPLFSQRAPILDVASVTGGVLVLDPASVSFYAGTDTKWQRLQSQPVMTRRVWPRDLRGRLKVDGERVEAFLPGVICQGRLKPLDMECTERQLPWPIGIDNTGLEASRNYFTSPEGLGFYGAAALGIEAGARWLVVDRDGALTLLDDARRSVQTVGSGEDVAGVLAPCRSDVYLIAASRASADTGGDVLRVFRVVGRRLIAAASPLVLPGTVAALWAAPGAATATVIAHDADGGRYDAFEAGLSCSR